jgi:hypothetical protein
MTTVEEIIAAAGNLKPDQFVKLRRRLDRLEQRLWEKELASATAELVKAGMNDRQIDQMVLRRRHLL